jgi:hypothetical protein
VVGSDGGLGRLLFYRILPSFAIKIVPTDKVMILFVARLPTNPPFANDQLAETRGSLLYFEGDAIFFAAQWMTRNIHCYGFDRHLTLVLVVSSSSLYLFTQDWIFHLFSQGRAVQSSG